MEQYIYGRWTAEDADHLKIIIGDPAGQTTWEYLALLLVLVVFGFENRETGLILLGDGQPQFVDQLEGGQEPREDLSRTCLAASSSWMEVCLRPPPERAEHLGGRAEPDLRTRRESARPARISRRSGL